MADFDAVVVGAGPNGLAAALRLAEAGWSVCLLEANDEIGGTARTLESTLPGFRHDFGAAFFPMATVAPVFTGRDLERFGLRFVHAPLTSAHPFPDGAALAMGRTTGDTAAWLAKIHHADADAWVGLDDRWGDAFERLMRLLLQRLPVREAAALALSLGPARTLDFAHLAVGSAESAASVFTSEEARAFLVAWAMHSDLPPEAPVSASYALLMALLGQRGGMPVAEGGSGAISAALGSAVIAAGGVVATRRPVDRFLVERGRVVGVETGGTPITAARAVIATLDPADVVARTGYEHFPSGALEQVRNYRRGLGTFKVDWALDGQVPWMADPCRQAGVVHIGDTVTHMSRSVWEAAHGLLPQRPTLVMGQQSLADPTRAPEGQHTLWGYARVPDRPRGDADRGDPSTGGDEISWDTVAEPFAERMEALIEEYAPGFRDRIVGRRVWTPKALEAADASLVDGDIAGGSFAIDQQVVFRPGPAWWRWGSPLKGLYLGGASTPPGGGVHGGCGDLAARQVLADFRRPGLAALAGAGTAVAAAAALRHRLPTTPRLRRVLR